MKISIGNLQNNHMQKALQKVDNHTGLDKKWVVSFNKLKAKVDYELKKSQNDYNELVKQYAVYEPVMIPGPKGKSIAKRNPQTGNIITRPKHVMINNQPELMLKDKDNFETGFQKLMDHKFEVKIFPFPTDILLQIGCTPAEIRACSPILADSDPELNMPEIEHSEVEKEDPSATDPNSEIKGAIAAPPAHEDMRL